MCPRRSHPDRGEKDGKKSIEHDHQEDGLDDGGGGLEPEGLGAALDLETLGACHDADCESHEGRLDEADLDMRERDRLPQPGHEDFRAHAAVEPSNETAAKE